MAGFQVDVVSRGDGSVVRVVGELDISTCAELAASLRTAEGTPAALIIDLSPTEFSDSAGMSELLRAYKRAEAGARPFAVVLPESNRDINRIVTLLGFDQVLPLFEDLSKALRATGMHPD
jgi:anti-sigma B factor antagonist